MSDRAGMRASLRRSLAPGAVPLVIEKYERSGHGIRIERRIAEMTAAGFAVVSRHTGWQHLADH